MKTSGFTGLVLVAALFVVLSGLAMPDVVASHFGSSGAADGFMPRNAYIGLMLVLVIGLPALGVGLVAWMLGRPNARINIPERAYWLAPQRRAATLERIVAGMRVFTAVLIVFLCYTHGLVVVANRSASPALPEPWFVGGLAAFMLFVIVWLVRFMRGFRRPDARHKRDPG